MDEQKQARIQSTIQKELGKIIERDLDVNPSTLVTITTVEYLPDNHLARVNISVFPENEQEQIISQLNRLAKTFVLALQKRIKMGYIPNLIFKYDAGIVKNARIQELIAKNKKSS
jgi:ribosome-binding factor A